MKIKIQGSADVFKAMGQGEIIRGESVVREGKRLRAEPPAATLADLIR